MKILYFLTHCNCKCRLIPRKVAVFGAWVLDTKVCHTYSSMLFHFEQASWPSFRAEITLLCMEGQGLDKESIFSVSVQFSLVVSDSLWPHGLQHYRPPCPSPPAGVYSNSCPLSRWCHPAILSSVVPFSSHLQSFPASGTFQGVSSSHQVATVLEF